MEDGDKSFSNDVLKSESRVEELENIQSVGDSLVERLDGCDSLFYVELVDVLVQVEKFYLLSFEIVEGNKIAFNLF